MIRRFRLFSILFFLLITWNTQAQDSTSSISGEKSFAILPAPFRYPETRFGLTIGAVYSFKLGKADAESRPSQIQAAVGYTQNRQFISFINSQLVTPGRKYLINTEFGYYDYFFPFGGIGFGQASDYNENYYVRFPRLRATVLKRLSKKFFLGPRLYYDDYTITRTEVGGLISKGSITGSTGGTLVQYGIISQFDCRDNIFSPYSGSFVELGLTGADKTTGSYSFVRSMLDVRYFLGLRRNVTLALNGVSDLYFGDPPFNGMAYLGGQYNLRGFYDGRYRNKKAISAQAEVRWRVLSWLGLVGFAGAGTVAKDIDGFRIDQLLVTAGPGLRIGLNQKERINFRIDYGITNKGYGNFYLTFFEAF